MEWYLIIKNFWLIFAVTTLYSYLSCTIVGIWAGMHTKFKKGAIDAAVDKFITSPFYVATFFSLFTVLYSMQAINLLEKISHNVFFHILALGLAVYLSHLLLEILESALIRKEPLRLLRDKEGLLLGAIYLLIIFMVTLAITVLR